MHQFETMGEHVDFIKQKAAAAWKAGFATGFIAGVLFVGILIKLSLSFATA